MAPPTPQANTQRMPSLPVRRSLTDDVYQALMSMLMDQVIAPGSAVIIDDVSRRLEVSPTPVREALARLESEGLVRREQHRGYTSSPALTPDAVDDLFAFRQLIEPWSAAQAARRATTDQLRRLTAELDSFRIAEVGQDYRQYRELLDHDARLHLLIAEAGGNAQVVGALGRTQAHVHLFRLRDRASGLAETQAEHRAVVDAILAGDARTARSAMTAHLRAARLRFPRSVPDTQEDQRP